ncbi:hypothetical protein Q8F55_008122 [Vanrija albida]|uniref:Uncharacterized protein n=1 Tax=Vanrija albida TaxID=181172 RepID=A0ABR3PVH3_9TREE
MICPSSMPSPSFEGDKGSSPQPKDEDVPAPKQLNEDDVNMGNNNLAKGNDDQLPAAASAENAPPPQCTLCPALLASVDQIVESMSDNVSETIKERQQKIAEKLFDSIVPIVTKASLDGVQRITQSVIKDGMDAWFKGAFPKELNCKGHQEFIEALSTKLIARIFPALKTGGIMTDDHVKATALPHTEGSQSVIDPMEASLAFVCQNRWDTEEAFKRASVLLTQGKH